MFLKQVGKAYVNAQRATPTMRAPASLLATCAVMPQSILAQQPRFGMLTKRSQRRVPVQVVGHVATRAFSLPDHMVMEMPNLSPTMEKVSKQAEPLPRTPANLHNLVFAGQHQAVAQEGGR